MNKKNLVIQIHHKYIQYDHSFLKMRNPEILLTQTFQMLLLMIIRNKFHLLQLINNAFSLINTYNPKIQKLRNNFKKKINFFLLIKIKNLFNWQQLKIKLSIQSIYIYFSLFFKIFFLKK